MINVMIIDHQRLMRQSLSVMLSQDSHIHVVAEAADAHEGFTKLLEKKPQIILVDINLPKLNCINTVKMILGSSEEVKILLLATDEDDPRIKLGLEAGAIGSIFKDIDLHELVRIIRHYAKHSAPITSPFLTPGYTFEEVSAKPPESFKLTRREKEVVELLASGMSTQGIAHDLSISKETVKVHTQHIYRKMGVKCRVEMLLALKPELKDGQPSTS